LFFILRSNDNESVLATPIKGSFRDHVLIEHVATTIDVRSRYSLTYEGQTIKEPADGGVYILIYCTSTNVGSTPQSPFNIDLKLVDPNNAEYAADVAASNILVTISGKSTTGVPISMNPGITVTTESVFEISKKMLDQQFWKIKYSLFGKTYLLNIANKNAQKNKQAEMVLVQGGTFKKSDIGDDSIRSVTLDSYYIGKYEVTMQEDLALHTFKKAFFLYDGDLTLPVEGITWFDAISFCNQKSEAEGLTPCYSQDADGNIQWDFSANGYRLPTEAEWEFAARGGNKSKGYTYSGSNTIEDVAWYSENSGGTTHLGGTKAPNELGIYDMSGNVKEWNWDWSGSHFSTKAQTNPTGFTGGNERDYRGGGFGSGDGECEVNYRSSGIPNSISYSLGFRLARNP